MNPITRVLDDVQRGRPGAAAELLPLVYAELRQLAAAKLAHESPGHTLEATALVHEAYIRILASPGRESGEVRFLVDNARRKRAEKHGGGLNRHDVNALPIAAPEPAEDLVALDEALAKLAAHDPVKAELVKLRYFAGLTIEQAADALTISPATAKRYWAYSKAWLYDAMTV